MGTATKTTGHIRPRVVLADLDTDWAPDPWRWCDHSGTAVDSDGLVDRALVEPIDRILVPFVGGRRREIALLGSAARLLFSACAALLVQEKQSMLSDAVFGYTVDVSGDFRHYRDELARRRDCESRLKAQSAVVASADIRRFFRSVFAEDVLSICAESSHETSLHLMSVLKRFDKELGYALPEGYSASRGIANLLLMPIDASIRVPFTRWMDDYRLFCADEDEADTALEQLRGAAAQAGFELGDAKTRIEPSSEHKSGADASLGDHGEDTRRPAAVLRRLILEESLPGESDREGRFALRTAAERRDVETLQVLAEMNPAEVSPAWLPRLAWLISAIPHSPSSGNLLQSLWEVDDEFRSWRRLRLAPALWYLPPGVMSETELLRAYEELPPARSALIRVLARHKPSALRRVPAPTNEDERRAHRLARIEARLGTDSNNDVEAAVRVTPPISSFL